MKYKFIFLCAYLLGGSMSLHAQKPQNEEVLRPPLSAQQVVVVIPEPWPLSAQRIVSVIREEWPTIPEGHRFVDLEHTTQTYIDQGINPRILKSFLRTLAPLHCPLHPESDVQRFDHDRALIFYHKALQTLATLLPDQQDEIFLYPVPYLSVALSSSVDFVGNVVCTPQEDDAPPLAQFFAGVFRYALDVTLETPRPLQHLETENDAEDGDLSSPAFVNFSNILYGLFEAATEIQREGTAYTHQCNICLAYYALQLTHQDYHAASYILKKALPFMSDAHSWNQWHELIAIIHTLHQQKKNDLAPLTQALETLQNTLATEEAHGTYDPATVSRRLQQLTI